MKQTFHPSISANNYGSLCRFIRHHLPLASLLLATVLPVQAESVASNLTIGSHISSVGNVSKQDIESTFNLLFSSMHKLYGFNFKVFDNQQELVDAFDQARIDVIFGLGLDILARESELSTKKAALVYANGQYKFRYLLLVRKADGINSIEQLQAKRLSLSRFHEIKSLYLNTLLLRHKQVESTQFFSEVVYAPISNVAISDVFFGRAEATVVNESEYQIALKLNPNIGQKLMVLEQLDPLVLFAVAMRKTISSDVQERVFNRAIDFQLTEAGRKAYKELGLAGLRIIDRSELDTLRGLKNEYQELKNASSLKTEQKSSTSFKPKSKSSQTSTASDKLPRNKKLGEL